MPLDPQHKHPDTEDPIVIRPSQPTDPRRARSRGGDVRTQTKRGWPSARHPADEIAAFVQHVLSPRTCAAFAMPIGDLRVPRNPTAGTSLDSGAIALLFK